MNLVTELYHHQYKKYNKNNQYVPRGTFNNIVNNVVTEHGIPEKLISFKNVLWRINNDNLTGIHTQRLSPLREKEHDIAEMIEAL